MKVLLSFLVIVFLSFSPRMIFAFWPVYDNHEGVKSFQNKKYENAINYFTQAIRESHDNPEYHYNQGNAQYRLNNFSDAEKEYLLSLNANDEEIRIKSLYNLGNVKFRQNDLNAALDYYEKALKIKPDYQEAELNRDFVKKQLENEKQQNQEKKNEDQKNNDKQKNQDQQSNQEEKQNKDTDQDKQNKTGEGGKQDQDKQNNEQGDQPGENKEGEQHPDTQDQSEKQNNVDQKPSEEPEKKDTLETPQNSDSKSETNLKERQLYRILESIGDDPGKALKEGPLKDGKPTRKQVERPW